MALLALLPGCPVDGDTPPLDAGTNPSSSSSDPPAGTAGDSSDDSGPEQDSTGDESPPSECPTPSSGPTMHPGENVTAAEVWTADGSPHLLPYDFTIQAPVLVEACAVVQIAGGVTITIAEQGSLVADGHQGAPISIERLDDEPWRSIRVLGGEAELFSTVISGGGAATDGVEDLVGALFVRAPSGATVPTEVLRLQDVEIRGSQGAGLRLDGLGMITADSTNLVITEGASHPISAAATVVGSIPPGSYVGNTDDRIVLTTANTETVFADTTIHERGVPYLVGLPGQVGELRVQAATGVAVLTIEPGVELEFQVDGVLTVEHATGDDPARGALVAVGTADAPIVFRSAAPSPAPGDWLGIYFGGTLDPLGRLEHARVEHAGGPSSSGSNSCMYPGQPINNAAIRLFGVPPGAFVTDTTIVASAGHGIDRGWRDDLTVDMLETNTFDVAGCTQTWSRLDDGSCPDPVPCP